MCYLWKNRIVQHGNGSIDFIEKYMLFTNFPWHLLVHSLVEIISKTFNWNEAIRVGFNFIAVKKRTTHTCWEQTEEERNNIEFAIKCEWFGWKKRIHLWIVTQDVQNVHQCVCVCDIWIAADKSNGKMLPKLIISSIAYKAVRANNGKMANV